MADLPDYTNNFVFQSGPFAGMTPELLLKAGFGVRLVSAETTGDNEMTFSFEVTPPKGKVFAKIKGVECG